MGPVVVRAEGIEGEGEGPCGVGYEVGVPEWIMGARRRWW